MFPDSHFFRCICCYRVPVIYPEMDTYTSLIMLNKLLLDCTFGLFIHSTYTVYHEWSTNWRFHLTGICDHSSFEYFQLALQRTSKNRQLTFSEVAKACQVEPDKVKPMIYFNYLLTLFSGITNSFWGWASRNACSVEEADQRKHRSGIYYTEYQCGIYRLMLRIISFSYRWMEKCSSHGFNLVCSMRIRFLHHLLYSSFITHSLLSAVVMPNG